MHTTNSAFSVRSYEVDSYGHLNNGVYASWFEQGRLDHLRSLGDFSYDGFAERQEWLVVARTEIDFRRPLKVGDRVELVSRIEELGRSSVRFRQHMREPSAIADAPVMAEALTVMVFHGPDGRSVPIPADFRGVVEGA